MNAYSYLIIKSHNFNASIRKLHI